MGYFSYNCQVCGRDLMSGSSCPGTPDWMKDVVVFMPDGIKITGEYTGFGSVKSGKTVWSSFVNRRREEQHQAAGTSLILVDGGKFFDKDKADADHGYLTMHMWKSHFLYNPCCYHRACWDAVGSPEGYRAPSLTSRCQGSGTAARVYGVANLDDPDRWDDDEGPIISRPSPGFRAIGLWANAVPHFLHTLSAWTAHSQQAEKPRELFRNFAKSKELFQSIGLILAEDEKTRNGS